MLDSKDRIIKAKVKLQSEKPFFAYLLMRFKIEENNEIPTMAVSNKGHLFYSTKFVDGLTDAELKGVLCHEVLHIALQHLERTSLNDRDPEIFNIANDISVNYILAKDGITLPVSPLIPSGNWIEIPIQKKQLYIDELNKKNTDQIYNEIIKQLPKKKKPKKSNGGGNGGDNKNPKKDNLPKGFDEHIYGKKNEPAEQVKRRVKETKQILTQAVEFARQKGNLPGGIKRHVDELLDCKLNWKQLLYNYITNELPSDYTYNRPSRRSESVGVYLPSVKRENMNVVVSVDTSGSISQTEIRDFLTEIAGITKAFEGVKATIIVCDRSIHEVYEIDRNNADTINELTFSGGGGTDHRPIFDYINEKLPTARIYVSLTDGYTSLPSETPSINTVWAITTGGKTEMPFGRVIPLEN